MEKEQSKWHTVLAVVLPIAARLVLAALAAVLVHVGLLPAGARDACLVALGLSGL